MPSYLASLWAFLFTTEVEFLTDAKQLPLSTPHPLAKLRRASRDQPGSELMSSWKTKASSAAMMSFFSYPRLQIVNCLFSEKVYNSKRLPL
jgi:hypothetical protein